MIWGRNEASSCSSSSLPSSSRRLCVSSCVVLGILRTDPSTSCRPGKCSTLGPHPQSTLVTGTPWEELAHPCEASFVRCRRSRTPPGADLQSSTAEVGLAFVTHYGDQVSFFPVIVSNFCRSTALLRAKDWFLFLLHVEKYFGNLFGIIF